MGFRDFARRAAQEFNLKGYVKNKKDSSMEIVVLGEEKNIESFIAKCRKGPLLAKVDRVNVEDFDSEEEFEYFIIRY